VRKLGIVFLMVIILLNLWNRRFSVQVAGALNTAYVDEIGTDETGCLVHSL